MIKILLLLATAALVACGGTTTPADVIWPEHLTGTCHLEAELGTIIGPAHMTIDVEGGVPLEGWQAPEGQHITGVWCYTVPLDTACPAGWEQDYGACCLMFLEAVDEPDEPANEAETED